MRVTNIPLWVMLPIALVENTLQMRVTNIQKHSMQKVI